MKIKWFGHACFMLEDSNGIKLLTDPFDKSVGYPLVNETVDIVTISHGHHDHNAIETLSDDFVVVDSIGTKKIGSISITGIATFHDDSNGSKRKNNNMYVIEMEDMKILHMGDLGHDLSQSLIDEIGDIDILIVPVGGNYTIDADVAYNIISNLNPKVSIPMHYKTPVMSFPIDTVDVFLDLCKFDIQSVGNEFEISTDSLDEYTNVVVMDYK